MSNGKNENEARETDLTDTPNTRVRDKWTTDEPREFHIFRTPNARVSEAEGTAPMLQMLHSQRARESNKLGIFGTPIARGEK